MAPQSLAEAVDRALLSLSTIPNLRCSIYVILITITSTAVAGLVAAGSGFIDPKADFDPPWRPKPETYDTGPSLSKHLHWSIKPLSAFIIPSLAEELLWRGILIAPHPSTLAVPGVFPTQLLPRAGIILGSHVALHPVAAYTCWPRGRKIFGDCRFLASATIILGGATLSYLVSGGSVWAAVLTHGVPVALWRDFFGGEALMMRAMKGE